MNRRQVHHYHRGFGTPGTGAGFGGYGWYQGEGFQGTNQRPSGNAPGRPRQGPGTGYDRQAFDPSYRQARPSQPSQSPSSGYQPFRANQAYTSDTGRQPGVYGGNSGLGYGGFGPYGQPGLGNNFGLGYGRGSYGGQTQTGPHVGKGPRNFQRTDEELQSEVARRLGQRGIDTAGIEITVEQGEVTLTGTVGSRGEKRYVEDVAESVGGVRDIHNRLRLAPSS